MYGIVPMVMPSVLLDFPNPLEEIPSQEGTDLAYIEALAEDRRLRLLRRARAPRPA